MPNRKEYFPTAGEKYRAERSLTEEQKKQSKEREATYSKGWVEGAKYVDDMHKAKARDKDKEKEDNNKE